MFEICKRDENTTDIRVWGELGNIEVRELVQAYCSYFINLPKQTVFVSMNDTHIGFKHMVYVFSRIKTFHKKYNLIDAVNLHMRDKHLAKCCRCLILLIHPSVPVNIVLTP